MQTIDWALQRTDLAFFLRRLTRDDGAMITRKRSIIRKRRLNIDALRFPTSP
jgi:hypothetical protein